jgi:signal transduction histidine kinase
MIRDWGGTMVKRGVSRLTLTIPVETPDRQPVGSMGDVESHRVGSAGRRLGWLGLWAVEPRWALFMLASTYLGYIGLIIALAPGENPAAPMLMAIPILVAGACFGVWVSLIVTGTLLVITSVVVELLGAGVMETVSVYRGIPILMLVVVGVVVGRLHDVSVAMAKEIQRSRFVERELRATEARLEGLLDAKDELIASVGHELRTPLTAVLGFAELLRVGGENEMAQPEREEMVEFIAREAFDLSGIVDDLLVAARIEIDRLEITRVPTSLRAQVAQVLEGWDRVQLPDLELVGDDVRAVADPARVRQVLRNLITNAIRYGGDRIIVNIGADATGAYVDVLDNGPGLPKTEWERIFEPHYRYHVDPNRPGSAGLGLTVSRGLAEKMGGTLNYRYDGQMSRFRLLLPTFRDPGS